MSTISRLFSGPAASIGNLRTLELPGLVLPTGQLVACDPLEHFDPQPFTQTCPAGHYPVYLHRLLAENRMAFTPPTWGWTPPASRSGL